MQLRMAAVLGLAAHLMAVLSIRQGDARQGQEEPKGPGQPEPTMQAACSECSKHAPYLGKQDPCVCFATDIMGTFEDDSTKTLTTRKEYGFETVNTGAKRLAEGWMWHCRPISGTPGVWKQC